MAEPAAGEGRIAVRDRGHWRPPRGRDSGRGLKIMEAAMDAVDVVTDAQGTRITMLRRTSQQ